MSVHDTYNRDMYLDYVNNFLTISSFTEHYNLTLQEATDIIDKGRKDNTSSKV